MMICSSESSNIAQWQSPRVIYPVEDLQIVMRVTLPFVQPSQVILPKGKGRGVNKSSCHPNSRATIVNYYTEPLLKQISDMPDGKRMCLQVTALLDRYDVRR